MHIQAIVLDMESAIHK